MFIQCPHCSSPVDDDDLQPGERFRCSTCDNPVVAPEHEDESMGRIPESHEESPDQRGRSSGPNVGRSSGSDRGSGGSSSADTSSEAEEQWEHVTQAYRMIYFIAFFALTLGAVSVGFDVAFLQQMGIGLTSALLGALMGLLGYGVFHGSVSCLILAILLFGTNAVLSLFVGTGTRDIGPRVGGFAMQLVLLYPLVRGVSPLLSLQDSGDTLTELISEHTTPGLHHGSAVLFGLTLIGTGGLLMAGAGNSSMLANHRFSPDEREISLTDPPGSPKRRAKTIDAPAGTVRHINYRWKTSGKLYSLAIFELPESKVNSTSNEQLLNQIFRGMSSHLERTVRRRDVTQEGHTGIEAEYLASSPHFSDTSKGRAAMYLKDSSVIMISYLTPKSEYSSQEAGSFTNTLQLE